MAITKDNFQTTMGMASSSSGGYYKFITGAITTDFNALKTTANNLINEGKNDQAKAAIRNIATKAQTVIDNYLEPAAKYIQECYWAAIAGYPKTSIKLAKLAILLLRAVRYQILIPNTLLPAKATDWVSSSQNTRYNAYVKAVNQINTTSTGGYARIVQIVGGSSVTTDLEKFLQATPFPYGDGGVPKTISEYVTGDGENLSEDGVTPGAIEINIAYITSALNLAISLTDDLYPEANKGGIARLTRFLEYAKTGAPTANSVNDPLYKIRIYDYIQYVDIAIHNSKALSTIASDVKSGLALYKTNRGTYIYKKRLRFLTRLQDSLERAQGLLVDISSRTARDLDIEIMNTQQGWMDLSVASIVATEIISRITNLERLIDAIETGEQNIIDDAQTDKSAMIFSSLNTINNKLVELTNSIDTVSRNNTKTDNRVSAFIQKIENARIEDGELVIEYQEPEESQLSGMNLLLQTIRTAVYGSDMRTAIADAINMLRDETITLVNNITALHNLYENRIKVQELDTYFSWQDLTTAEKEADVIYLLMDDNTMIYKQKPYYFASLNSRTASFGSIDSNYGDGGFDSSLYTGSSLIAYGDVAFDLSLYSGSDLTASSDVITDIELEDPSSSEGGT